MRVMLFEQRYRGHHLSYVQLLASALHKIGCKVTLAGSPDLFCSSEYQSRKTKLGDVAEFSDDKRFEGAPDALAQSFTFFRRAVQELRPDHVLIPTADGLVPKLGEMKLKGRTGFIGKLEIEANLLRPRFAMPGLPFMNRLKMWGIRKLIRRAPTAQLFTIDGVALAHLQRLHPALAARFKMMPDPLDGQAPISRAEARLSLGIPPDARVIGIVGVLDHRKGVDRLLSAFERANAGERCIVLLAGPPDAVVAEELQTKFRHLVDSQRVIAITKLLSEDEVATAVAALDVMCTPYVGHLGPSSMVMRAIANGTPVLASEEGWVCEMVRRLKAGWTCDVLNEGQFAATLKVAFQSRDETIPVHLAQRVAAYSAPENFCNVWLARIRQKLSLPAAPIVKWESLER